MKRYRITYRNENDSSSPRFTWFCNACNAQHAVDKFSDGPDAEGWEILAVVEVRTHA